MTRNEALDQVRQAVDALVTAEMADMIRDGELRLEEVTSKFMLSFVRTVRELTDWPQLNKR